MGSERGVAAALADALLAGEATTEEFAARTAWTLGRKPRSRSSGFSGAPAWANRLRDDAEPAAWCAPESDIRANRLDGFVSADAFGDRFEHGLPRLEGGLLGNARDDHQVGMIEERHVPVGDGNVGQLEEGHCGRGTRTR